MRILRFGWLGFVLVALLSACGGGSGGTPFYTVSGAVSGLDSGSKLVLTNNGSDTVTISANGNFSFPQAIAQNGNYSVTISSAPTGEVCSVSNGQGSGVTANVSNVQITCSPTTSSYSIGGSLSGLAAGASVTLLNNGADPTKLNSNGSFSFPTSVASGASYNVTVGAQPAGQICTVSLGTGTGVNSNVSNVNVVCASTSYTIGGTVSGLSNGQQVTLLNNGDNTNPVTVTANGDFSFSTKVSGGYNVTVGTQPSGATCSVSNASGTATADVSNVIVSCSANSISIGGSVSGLASGQTATIQLNGDSANTVSLSATTNNFTFPTGVTPGAKYSVTVLTQPTAETCTVTNGNGTATSIVTNVTVTCATPTVSTLTYSSGFQTTKTTPATTVEGGGFGGYGGSSLDGSAAYPPTSGFGAGTVADNLSAAQTYTYFYYQFPQAALPSNGPSYEYVGVFVQAPGVTALNNSADTKGLQIAGQNYINFTFNENPEWANSNNNNFVVLLTLGKYYNIGTSTSPTTCNLKLQTVIQPASAATASTATAYKIPLSDFVVAQNCGQASISTAAEALAISPISQIDFQGDGGGAALTVNGVTSGSNLTVANTANAVVPTTIAITGGITFTQN